MEIGECFGMYLRFVVVGQFFNNNNSNNNNNNNKNVRFLPDKFLWVASGSRLLGLGLGGSKKVVFWAVSCWFFLLIID